MGFIYLLVSIAVFLIGFSGLIYGYLSAVNYGLGLLGERQDKDMIQEEG